MRRTHAEDTNEYSQASTLNLKPHQVVDVAGNVINAALDFYANPKHQAPTLQSQ